MLCNFRKPGRMHDEESSKTEKNKPFVNRSFNAYSENKQAFEN